MGPLNCLHTVLNVVKSNSQHTRKQFKEKYVRPVMFTLNTCIEGIGETKTCSAKRQNLAMDWC